MKQRVINGNALEFFDSANTKKGEIKISGSNIIINPLDANGTVIFGEEGTVNDIEVGAVGTPVDFTFAGGGTLTSNGGTLTIGNSGDTIDLSSATIGAITASAFVGGTFEGNGSGLTGVVPDLSGYNGNVVVTGSLQVTGKVTAEEFHTEFVSASITYKSGSTKSGDTADDTHSFTGSLSILHPSAYGAKIDLRTSLHKWTLEGGEAGYSADSLALDYDGSTFIRMLGTSDVRIGAGLAVGGIGVAAPSNGLYVAGNVGIGTASPQSRLHITDANPVFIMEDTSNPNKNKIENVDGNMRFHADYGSDMGNSRHIFFIDNSEKLRIDTNGNVGIGTTAPSTKLHITNSSHPYQLTLQSDTATKWRLGVGTAGYYQDTFILNSSLSGDVLFFNTAGLTLKKEIKLDFSDNSTNLSSGGKALRLANTDTTVNNISAIDFPQSSGGSGFSRIGVIYKDRTSSSEDQDMFFRTIGGGSSAEVMRLTSDGNVAINSTITSGYRLYVNGSTWINGGTNFTDGVSIFRTESGAAEVMRIASNGNVGMGTASPGGKLHVSSSNSSNLLRLQSPSAQFTFYTNSTSGYNTVIGMDNTGLDIGHDSTSRALNLKTGNADRLTITGAGNIGINNTAPIVPLDIEGTVRIRGNNTRRLDLDSDVKITGQYYSNSSTEHTYLKMYNGADASINMGTKHPLSYISFESGNGAYTERMRITNTGNVGIGTTSPSHKLHVSGSGEIFRIQGDTGQSYMTFYQGTGGRVGYVGTLGANGMILESQDKLSLYSGGSTTVQLTADSKVGIGTFNPTHKLHVSGTHDVFKIEGSGSANSSSLFEVHGNNGLLFAIDDDLSDSLFSVNTVAGLPVIEAFSDNRVVMGAFNQNDFVISGSKVGIGTATPAHKLSVDGNIQLLNGGFIYGQSTGNYLKLDNATYVELGYSSTTAVRADGSAVSIRGTGGTPRLTVQSAGNVGIGITNPTDTLQVKSEGADDGIALIKSNNTNRIVTLIETGTGDGAIIARDTSNSQQVLIRAQGSSYLNGGNVGIGTTSPARPLHVVLATNDEVARFQSTQSNDVYIEFMNNTTSGISKFGTVNNDFIFYPDGSTEALRIKSNGNVGIGTGTPAEKLHVSGSVRVDGNTGTAPQTSGGHSPTDIYGQGDPSFYLGTPDKWLRINLDGVDYVIPAYIPA